MDTGGVHEKIKKFQCSLCSNCFTLSGNLKKHIEVVHEKIKNSNLVTALVVFHNLDT
uniref:C2H2-type domain-containing protein n=1 Tax=Lepeophtheirus salmonis TaxID=72036 RepID=A0A0K2V1Y9_LEPSM